jgi:hypothetical protein
MALRFTGVLASALVAVGLLLVFIGQQVLVDGTARNVALVLAAASVLAGLAGRVMGRAAAPPGSARTAETDLLVATGCVVLGLAVYGLSTDAGLALFGVDDEPASDAQGGLRVIASTLFVVAGTALLFMELAYRRMPLAEAIELRRIRSAGLGGVSLALALVFLTSMNYVASERDVRRDLSYLKTTRPSDATLAMVRNLGEPLDVIAFYPEVNEVRQKIEPYFEAIAGESDQLNLAFQDHALSPSLARDHRIRGNGFVLLLRGPEDNRQAESFEIGTELEAARSRLKTLDGKFQQAFAKLVRRPREIAFTTGHQERNDRNAGTAAGETVDNLKAAFERANVDKKDLGIDDGLATRVDPETPAVMVLGPRQPFLPEEADALLSYVKAGGRLAIFVDPDVDHGLAPLLQALGVELREGIAHSEESFFPRTRTTADRANVFTNRYSSHPTVTIASRNSSQLVTVFLGGGALAEYQGEGRVDGVDVSFPVRSGGQFWLDQDGDHERDRDAEPAETLNLMAVVTVPNPDGEEGRAVIIADGEFMTDQLMRLPFANGYVTGDILNWFLGEEQIIGDTTSEEDVRVQFRKEEDALLFYGTSFGVPLPILGLGVWVSRRRRSQRVGARKEEKSS